MREPLEDKNVNTSKQYSLYVKQYIAGIGDSIAIVFAFCFALSILYNKSESVVSIGAIATIILSCIMGFGSYLSAKTATLSLLETSPEEEKIKRTNTLQKTLEQLNGLDIGEDLQKLASDAIAADENEWASFLEQQKQPKEKPVPNYAFKSAIASILASITGSTIALAAWLVVSDSTKAMNSSLAFCLPMLFITGYLKSKVNAEPLWWGAIRQLLMGGALALGGYCIATIFQ